MNTLSGQISSVETKGSLSLVKVQVGTYVLSTIVIDTPKTAPFLKVGAPVKALFKETEVVIGLDQDHAISLQNRISGSIKSIQYGDLLSKVLVQSDTDTITSIITTQAVNTLSLKEGMAVQALIKTNEIMLSE